jgi:hypothetical protein
MLCTRAPTTVKDLKDWPNEKASKVKAQAENDNLPVHNCFAVELSNGQPNRLLNKGHILRPVHSDDSVLSMHA